MSSEIYDYYYGNEAEQFTFLRLPKYLFTEDEFKTLSSDAKILFGLMLDRMGLSIKNKWLDKENHVYIIFTLEEAQEIIGCGHDKCTKIFNELLSIGLIARKRQGLGKPAIIYVKNFVHKIKNEHNIINTDDRIQDCDKAEVMTAENQQSEMRNISIQERGKSAPSNTYNIKNKISDTDNQSYQSSLTPLTEKQSLHRNCKFIQTDMNEEYEEIIKENISYDVMLESYTDDCTMMPIVEEIKDLIVDVVSCRRCVYINKKPLPYEVSKSRFLKLTYEHVIQILSNIFSVNGKIKCMDSYLCTALYNITFSHNTSLLSGITANTGIVMI